MTGAHARWLGAQGRYAQRLVGVARDSAARAEVEGLRLAAEEFERRYAAILSMRGVTVAAEEPGLAEVRERLQPGQALVAFVEIDTGSDSAQTSAFVARGGEQRLTRIELPHSAELRGALDPWLENLATAPSPQAGSAARAERECRRLGRAVRALTWDRIAPSLDGATDIFVVADGPLLQLPWQALPDGEKRCLVETMPRLHLINAERELVTPARTPEAARLLAVGDPAYQHLPGARDAPLLAAATTTVRASMGPCAEGRLPPLAALPGSGAEAEEAARAWRASGSEVLILRGAQASEAELKRIAPGKTVIHLATHGVVARDTCTVGDAGLRGVGAITPPGRQARAEKPPSPRPAEESPWMGRRVWLALAGANRASEYERDENEGLLTAEEVVTLDLEGTDWVVLSACHSGLAETWSREGTLGMRRAFHLAGARTVIASQWAVKDQATREWMRALYAARTSGAATAEAMQAASRSVLQERRRTQRTTHPFYWAAFTATGE